MQHILFILDYYLPHRGGVETVFEQIITRCLQVGYRVTVLTSHYDPSLPAEEKTDNLRIVRTGKSRKSFVFSAFFRGSKLLKEESDIAFIHTSTYGGAIPASLLGKLYRKKVLLTVHEVFGKLRKLYKPWKSRRLFQLFEWLIFQLPYDCYHCVSLYTLNSLRLLYWISDAKLKLIHNGVDYDFWDSKKIEKSELLAFRKKYAMDQYFTLLYFGHTGVSKGLDFLVDALPRLFEKYADLKLIFNLIHAQRNEFLVAKILDFQASLLPKDQERIILLQGLEKSDLRTLVAAVDAVVAPSLSEGFGSVHTETLALGTPLLTTYIASLFEVLWGEVVFIEPGSIDAIVGGVQKLREKNFATNSPIKVFSWEETFSQLQEIYQSFLK